MARNKKQIYDKFYTKPELCIELTKHLNLNEYDLIIEPSAGNGSFSNNIIHNNLISLDIEPENSNIIKMNWFDFSLDKNYNNILVIGNPPFGNNGSLAFKFINKCKELNISTIAFILPKSFKKDSYKNRIPLEYSLSKQIDINDNSYYLMGNEYSVPSVFQIWKKTDIIREKKLLKTKSDKIFFVKKGEFANFTFRRVGFYAGRIYDDLNKSEQSHYFIKCNDDIKEYLKNYIWEHNNTSGPKSISKSEIINIVENKFGS